MPRELLEHALHGGSGNADALRVMELQLLQNLVAQTSRGRGQADEDDLFNMTMPALEGAPDGAGGSAARGTSGMLRIRRSIAANPKRWVDHFNASIQEELGTDVTGMPWSLEEYTRRRLRFTQDQESEEKFAAIVHRMHALHLAGPDKWWELGALICQSYKSLEQVVRDRDWTLAWMWTGIQDPRPRGPLQRGLAHPLEHAAGLAHLKEMHTLHTQRAAAAGRGSWVPGASAGSGASASGKGGQGQGRNQQQWQAAEGADQNSEQSNRGRGGRGRRGRSGRGTQHQQAQGANGAGHAAPHDAGT